MNKKKCKYYQDKVVFTVTDCGNEIHPEDHYDWFYCPFCGKEINFTDKEAPQSVLDKLQ